MLLLDGLTPDVAPRGAGNWPPPGHTEAESANQGRKLKRQLTGALPRSIPMVAGLAAAAVVAVGLASPASAHGGGAGA